MEVYYVISLLLCFVAVHGSVRDISRDVVTDEQVQKPRLIVNPFGVFGNARCTDEGDEGRCNGLIECVALAGDVKTFCPGLQGPCCVFYRTCNQRTAQEVSYFRNAKWPEEEKALDNCAFKVIRRSDSFCGLRVQAEQGHLPTKSGTCGNAYVHIVGAGNRSPLPLCGRSSGIDYALDFRHVDTVTINVNSTSRTTMGWNIKLSQILCTEFGGETGSTTTGGSGGGSISVGGEGSTGGSGGGSTGVSGGDKLSHKLRRDSICFHLKISAISSSWPSPPSPPGPPAPIAGPPAPMPPAPRPPSIKPPAPMPPAPVTYSACGVKGRSSIKRTRDAAAPSGGGGSRDSSSKSWFTRPGVQGPPADRRNKSPDIAPDNPFIRDLEFLGPDVNDSVFHYFKGEDSLLTTRVTYGSDTSPSEYPWQVAMFLGSRYHCGASVIGDWFILTAAHCVESYKSRPSSLKLSIGDWDLSNKNDGPYVEAQVAAIRVHPKYARTNLQNDLAVLKLTAKLDYSDKIRPVCLPTSDIPTDGEQATITGWGRDENQRLKTTLQELTADITTNALCNKRWQSNNAASDFIVDTMMCMDASNGDSCNGDSGGPSVMEYPKGSGKYVQVGIVSFGSGSCTDTNLPGVYTRVAKYRDWIRQQMY